MKLFIKILLSILILIWCLGIFNQFIFEEESSGLISVISDPIFANVCHQNSERLITDGTHKSMVCSRCAGIYSGVLLLSLFLLFLNNIKMKSIKYLYIFLIPMLADVILSTLGVYDYNKLSAFITGLLSGSVVIIYIHDVINKFFVERKAET